MNRSNRQSSTPVIRKSVAIPFICVIALLTHGCADTEDDGGNSGVASVSSTRLANTIFNDLDMALQANDNISVVARVDHAMNAASVDLTLRPTKVIFFGNPRLGTPLMQNQQTTGIDLPQKFAVREQADGSAEVLWNSANYLQNRHGLTTVDEQLGMINTALQDLATSAAQNDDAKAVSATVAFGEGLVQRDSNQSFDDTVAALRGEINRNPNLTLVFELDHQANAASVGLELRPTTLFVFGNPAAGTPLMQSKQRTALDLPQKILVYQNADGVVRLAYNSPAYIAKRHNINGQQQRLEMINGALASLAAATTN